MEEKEQENVKKINFNDYVGSYSIGNAAGGSFGAD